MAEIVYAVVATKYQEPDEIKALFSSEDLAQTAAAKLRVGYPKLKFIVRPTQLDELAAVEPIFWAYTTIRASWARDTNLNIQVQADGVGLELPASSTQHTPADDMYGFSAFGWDKASATAAVEAMVKSWYAGLSAEWLHEHGAPERLAPHHLGGIGSSAPF